MRSLILVLFFSFLISPVYIHAQADKKQREYDRKKEIQKKEAEKKYFEAIKNNYKMQTPEVRKQMKRSFKESRRIAENRKQFFIIRWYNNIFNKRRMIEHQNNKRQKA
jgi:hypothetical protein